MPPKRSETARYLEPNTLPTFRPMADSVKVVMGFLELAAALKFFRTAELGVFRQPPVWLAIALSACGPKPRVESAEIGDPEQGVALVTVVATFLFLLPVAIFTFLLRNHLLRGMSFGAIRK